MVASPCIGLCRIDPHSGYCAGCARMAAEIASWTSASDGEKLRILAELPMRREQLTAQIQRLPWSLDENIHRVNAQAGHRNVGLGHPRRGC
jgi:uncharacterized protein